MYPLLRFSMDVLHAGICPCGKTGRNPGFARSLVEMIVIKFHRNEMYSSTTVEISTSRMENNQLLEYSPSSVPAALVYRHTNSERFVFILFLYRNRCTCN